MLKKHQKQNQLELVPFTDLLANIKIISELQTATPDTSTWRKGGH